MSLELGARGLSVFDDYAKGSNNGQKHRKGIPGVLFIVCRVKGSYFRCAFHCLWSLRFTSRCFFTLFVELKVYVQVLFVTLFDEFKSLYPVVFFKLFPQL